MAKSGKFGVDHFSFYSGPFHQREKHHFRSIVNIWLVSIQLVSASEGRSDFSLKINLVDCYGHGQGHRIFVSNSKFGSNPQALEKP